MQEFVAFSVKETERAYFKAVEKKRGCIIHLVKEPLRIERVQEIPTGVRGVLVLPTCDASAKVIQALHQRGITAIATRSSGLDAIDLAAAEQYEIAVTNVENYSPQAIAELAIQMMLTGSRNILQIQKSVRQLDFRGAPYIGVQMDKQTVGIVGYGHIGQKVKELLQPFGCHFIVYHPKMVNRKEGQVVFTNKLSELLSNSTIITLHCPATPETYHLINHEALQMMGDQTILINTARGAVVDLAAVLENITNGKISFYGCDVIENENVIFHKHIANKDEIKDEHIKQLLQNDRVMVTPHVAYNTYTSTQKMVEISVDNLLGIFT